MWAHKVLTSNEFASLVSVRNKDLPRTRTNRSFIILIFYVVFVFQQSVQEIIRRSTPCCVNLRHSNASHSLPLDTVTTRLCKIMVLFDSRLFVVRFCARYFLSSGHTALIRQCHEDDVKSRDLLLSKSMIIGLLSCYKVHCNCSFKFFEDDNCNCEVTGRYTEICPLR